MSVSKLYFIWNQSNGKELFELFVRNKMQTAWETSINVITQPNDFNSTKFEDNDRIVILAELDWEQRHPFTGIQLLNDLRVKKSCIAPVAISSFMPIKFILGRSSSELNWVDDDYLKLVTLQLPNTIILAKSELKHKFLNECQNVKTLLCTLFRKEKRDGNHHFSLYRRLEEFIVEFESTEEPQWKKWWEQNIKSEFNVINKCIIKTLEFEQNLLVKTDLKHCIELYKSVRAQVELNGEVLNNFREDLLSWRNLCLDFDSPIFVNFYK